MTTPLSKLLSFLPPDVIKTWFEFRPMTFASNWLPVANGPLRSTPFSTLPVITFPSAELVPPIRFLGPVTKMPSSPLAKMLLPSLPRPIRLFCTELAVAPWPSNHTPLSKLPEITFCWARPGPPMVLLAAPFMSTPLPPLPSRLSNPEMPVPM